jgi:hypothetical protein
MGEAEGEEAVLKQHELWFLVYVRWDSGERETIRTQMPRMLAGSDRMVVLACLPEARMSVQPAEPRWAGRR